MANAQPFDVRITSPSHVIIEIFGGDNNLDPFVSEDINEMIAGNSESTVVLALADYSAKPASVFEISAANGVRVVEEWGEIDTGDPVVLANFLARALVTYGAGVHKAIGFWDHGSGVFDEHDPNEVRSRLRLPYVPRERRQRSRPARKLFFSRARVARDSVARAMLHDDTNGGVLTNLEAGKMLAAAFNEAGQRQKVDLIFSDTCLNGMIEVTEQLKAFAHCIVASEDLEPGDGWEYQEWLSAMGQQPPQTADSWAAQAVEAFRIGYDGRTNEYPCTLGAFRTENGIATQFAKLIEAVKPLGQQGFDLMDRVRRNSQSFANKDTYDMKDFAVKLAAAAQSQPAVQTAANDLSAAFDAARVTSTALGPTVRDSYGLAFWFPATKRSYEDTIETYARLDFSTATGWGTYLHASLGQ